MADIDKTVEIVFGVVDNASSTFGNIESSVNKFSSSVTKPLSEAGNAALKTEAAIIGMGVAFLGVAVNEAAAFQTSLNEIGTLFNATPEEVTKLKNEVLDFGATSVFSLEDTTAALYNMVSATGDVENSVAGLTTAQSLATVAGTDLNTSVNALTTVLNSYGSSMDEAGSISDALFITVQNGKTTLTELEAGLGQVAATAAAADVPFDDLGAAVAALTGAGVKTAQSMTVMQAIIKELADPTDVLKAAMGGLSLQTDGLKPVMDALKESTGGGFVEMSRLFSSVEAVKGSIILANDKSGTFSKTLQQMADKTGVVTDNMKLMEKNLNLVTQNMKTNLNIAMIAIGDNLKGEWTEIVGGLSSLFAGTKVALDAGAFDKVFEGLNDFQSAMSTYLEGIAKVLPDALSKVDFTVLVNSFGNLGESIGGIFGNLDLTDADDLAKAIQFIIDSVASLTEVVAGIVSSWEPALGILVKAIDEFNKTGSSSKLLVGDILGLSQQFEAFKGILTGVIAPITALGAALVSFAAAKYLLGITAGATGLSTALSLLGKAMLTVPWVLFAAAAADAAASLVSGERSSLSGALDYLFKQVKGFDSFDDWIASLEFLEAKNRKAALATLELKGDIQKLKNATGDATITQANYLDKLTEFILNTNKAAYEAEQFGVKLGKPLKATSTLTEALKLAGEVAAGQLDTLDALGTKLGKVGLNSEEASKYFELLADNSRTAAEKLELYTKAVAAGDSATELAVLSMELFGTTTGRSAEQIQGLIDAAFGVAETVNDSAAHLGRALTATEAYGAVTEKIISPINNAERAIHNLTDSQRLSSEITADLEKTLEELASNEKIAAMKFTAEINVAQINAQAKQIEAAFASTASVINSLSEGVTNLYAIFATVGEGDRISKTAQEILNAAKRQEDRLDRELAIKAELTFAQLELMKLQADALASDTIVKIESSGLEQHIEAFMFEILKQIQLKVAGDRSAFLLGVGGATGTA